METDDTEVLQQALETPGTTPGIEGKLSGSETSRRTQIEHTLAVESENALALEERKRTQRVAPFMACLGTFAFAALPLFGGTLWAKRLLQTSLALGVIAMLVLWWLAATNRAISGWRGDAAWTMGFVCTCTNSIYFGVYSPASAMMIMAVVVFAMGNSGALAFKLYLLATATEATVAILDATGVMADPGVLSATHLPLIERIAGQVLVQSFLLAGLYIGRSARHATSVALAKMRSALHDLARRDVIAREAQDKVRRALNIGGAGRYSGAHFGSFRLAELIGHGGMGEIYLATNTETDDLAAVKIIHAHLAQDEGFVKRFLRETTLSSQARSPHIVHVLESGHDDGGPYMAMELLSGVDLAGHLSSSSSHGTMPLLELCFLAKQVGAGLDCAAQAGIVHRDIKPQNIFLAGGLLKGPTPLHCKILDFGVARVMSKGHTITQGSSLLGTPAYMAPEQAKGETVDHRADLHALAAVLYRAATGLPPFSGDTPMAILLQVAQSMPVPVSTHGLPESLNAFFDKGLAKNPDQRFQSGKELGAAFEAACGLNKL